MTDKQFDLVVIGAGPAGYVAAIRAAQLGMQVACVEKDSTLGGTCLNVGCIPSKALLEASEKYDAAKHHFSDFGVNVASVSLDVERFFSRKDEVVKQLTQGVALLFKKNKIKTYYGNAEFISSSEILVKGQDTQTIRAKNILIATGSTPIELPQLPFNHKTIIDSTDALSLRKIPQKLIVVGGGYIGLELGSVYARLGSEVLVLEAFDRLVPAMDAEIAKFFTRSLQKQGLKIETSAQVISAKALNDSQVEVLVKQNNQEKAFSADCVLVSVGRKPNVTGLGLDKIGVQLDSRNRIIVDDYFKTNIEGVYAIGDVIDGPMLAHKASEEGVAVVEYLAGRSPKLNYAAIPSVVYTWPEVASVGFNEEELKEKKVDYKSSKFYFLGSGKAIAMGEKEGMVKLLADKKTDRLLGAHIFGARASDLIAELSLAIHKKLSSAEVAHAIYAHPTLAETIKEAALGLGEGSIHA